jgi:autotransporter-associated beta strand protein
LSPLWVRVALAVAVSFLAGRPAAAQSYTWLGGVNGNWSTAGNWSPAGPPVATGTDTGLIFGATANPNMTDDLITPGGIFKLNYMTFTSAAPAYTLGGGFLSFQVNSGNIFPGISQNGSNPVTINNNIGTSGLYVGGTGTGTVTLNGAVSGSGFLVVQTAGTVVLGNGSNTYTGAGWAASTFVYGGTLQLGSGTAIPTGTNVLVVPGGTFSTAGLSNNSATAIGSLYLGGLGYQQGGTFRVPTGSGDYYLNTLNMTGGTMDFTGTNNFWLHFTGPGSGITTNASSTTATWIGAAISRIQNDTSSPLYITVAPRPAQSGYDPSVIDLDAGIILSAGGTNPTFVKDGRGTMRLTNPGNTANLILKDGRTRVDTMAALGSGTVTLNGGWLVYQGPTATSAKSLTLNGTSLDAGVVYLSTSGTNLTLTGSITEASAGSQLWLSGPGTLTLTNPSNTYTGNSYVWAGATLAVPTITNSGTASPIGPATTINLGGYLSRGDLLLTGTAANYSTDRALVIHSNGGIGAVGVQNPGTTLTLNGRITGGYGYGGTFVKTGPGTVILNNTSNNYTSGTVVEQGKLLLGAAGTNYGYDFVPAGSTVTVNTGAELNTNGGFNSNPINLALNGGTFRMTLSDVPEFSLTRLDLTGGLVDTTANTSFFGLYFFGANAGIGTNPSTQTASLVGNAGPGSGLFNRTSAPLSISVASGTTPTGIDLDVAFALNYDGFGNASYVKTGTGTLRLTGPGVASGVSLTVQQGRLRVDDVTSNGGNGAFGPGAIVFDGGTFQWAGTASTATVSKPFTINGGGMGYEVTNPGTVVTQSGLLTGAGGITKSGPGFLTLSNTANTFQGGVTVTAGTLLIPAESALGSGPLAAGPAGTIQYAASATTGRTFTLTGGTLRVADGVTLTFDGATVSGGFLRASGSGNYVVGGNGAALNGVTVFNGTPINQAGGPVSAQNLTFGGTHTVGAGQTFTLDGGNYTASSQLTVNGTANVTDFATVGKVSVLGTGLLTNTGGSPLVFGGGSVTNVGAYNPANGQVTPGGTISLAAQDMVVQGGFVRNNGRITSTTGNLVIDAGGVVRGAGVFDVNAIVRQNGGLLYAGNSPGLVVTRNLTLDNGGATVADLSNAAGLAGSANPAGFSGWGVYEYGATNLTSGSLTVTATPSNKSVVKFNTVTDAPPRNAYTAAANFDPTRPYAWVVFRPGTTAGLAKANGTVNSGNQDDFTTQNTVAQISITDAATGTVYSHANGNLTAAVLNQYLRFDPSAGTPAGALGFVDPSTGAAILPSAGTFGFVLGPDTLGNPDRVILLTYTPVPEPASSLLLAAAASALTGCAARVLRRRGRAGGTRPGRHSAGRPAAGEGVRPDGDHPGRAYSASVASSIVSAIRVVKVGNRTTATG